MDHLEYEYVDHVLCVQPSEFEKGIILGVFGKEALPRPVVEVEYKSSKRTGCNPIILTALAEIKNGLQELKGLALTPAPKPPPESSVLAEMEKRIIAAVTGRKPDKKSETHPPSTIGAVQTARCSELRLPAFPRGIPVISPSPAFQLIAERALVEPFGVL